MGFSSVAEWGLCRISRNKNYCTVISSLMSGGTLNRTQQSVPPCMVKILLILSIVFGFATAGVGFLNFQKLGGLKGRLADAEGQIPVANAKIEELTKTKTDLDKQLADSKENEAKLSSEGQKLKADIALEKSKVSEMGEKVAMKDAELTIQKGKLESQAEDLVQLKEKLAEIEATPSLPPEDIEKIGKLENENSQLQDKIASLRGEINTLKQQSNEKTLKAKLTNLKGKVLAVNHAWNFVVVDIGDKQGLLSNTELLVKRGTTSIGRVKITSVEPASSIADIIPASGVPGLTIRPGDEVIVPSEIL